MLNCSPYNKVEAAHTQRPGHPIWLHIDGGTQLYPQAIDNKLIQITEQDYNVKAREFMLVFRVALIGLSLAMSNSTHSSTAIDTEIVLLSMKLID